MIDQNDTVTNLDKDTRNILFFYDVIIQQVDWIDDNTRNSAIKKVNMMNYVNPYPDELSDDTKLNEFYQTLELSKDNLFENFLNISLFHIFRSYSSLRVIDDRDHWTTERAKTVFARNYSRQNSVCKYI